MNSFGPKFLIYKAPSSAPSSFLIVLIDIVYDGVRIEIDIKSVIVEAGTWQEFC